MNNPANLLSEACEVGAHSACDVDWKCDCRCHDADEIIGVILEMTGRR